MAISRPCVGWQGTQDLCGSQDNFLNINYKRSCGEMGPSVVHSFSSQAWDLFSVPNFRERRGDDESSKIIYWRKEKCSVVLDALYLVFLLENIFDSHDKIQSQESTKWQWMEERVWKSTTMWRKLREKISKEVAGLIFNISYYKSIRRKSDQINWFLFIVHVLPANVILIWLFLSLLVNTSHI